MKTKLQNAAAAVVIAAGLLALAGCSIVPAPKADPTRYYVLAAQPEDAAVAAKQDGALVIGLKRIEIAPYLNGKDMVVRERGNEIVYQSFARWAETPSASITRAVAENLARAETVARVHVQPYPFDVKRDYDVAIRVLRCEGARKEDGGSVASFSAQIEVIEAVPGGAVVLSKVFTAPEAAWDGRDFGALAAVLGGQVAALGAEAVAALAAVVPAQAAE